MTNFITRSLAVLLVAVSVGFADSVTFEVADVEGHKIVGSLEKLSADEVTLKTTNGSQSLRKENLATIKLLMPVAATAAAAQNSEQPPPSIFHLNGKPIASSRYIPPDTVQKADGNAGKADVSLLFLTDGSRVFVTEYIARGPDASFTLFGKTTPVSVPLSNIAALIMSATPAPANNPKLTPKFDTEKVLTPEWQTFLRKQTVDDRLIVTRAGSLDAFNGIIREATREHIVFETDGELMPVPRAKVSGLIYRRTSNAQRSEFAIMTDVAGNRYVVSDLKFENGKLLWQGVANWSGELLPEGCESVVFPQANVIPLTALKPVSVVRKLSFDWNESANAADTKTPKQLFMQLTSPRFDNAKPADGGLADDSLLTSEVGGTVQMDGYVYDNCLRLSGKTVLTYELPETVARLRGVAGIADADRPNSRAKLSITGDGATLFERVLSGDEPATELRLELNGVKKLTISVDFADGASCKAVMGAMRLLQ